MRYSFLIDDLAQAELDAVGGTYISHFAMLGDPAKGRSWANRFYAGYRRCIDGLKDNPYRHPTCSVYPFSVVDTEYGGFAWGGSPSSTRLTTHAGPLPSGTSAA